MKIIQATLEQLSDLSILFDAYRVFYRKPSDIPAATAFLKDRIQQEESIIYIAYDQDEALGFTQLYPQFSSTRMKRIWLLNDLYVKPEARGRGISKLLINAAKKLAKNTNAAAVILETEKSNVIGNRLYPAVGFELDKDHNFYEWSVA